MSTPEKVNVAVVQMSCTDNKQQNVDKSLAKIAEAAQKGANIVCLQELFPGPYFCQTEDHLKFQQAEPIPGPTSRAMQDAAKQHGMVVVASLFEARAPGLYHNTTAVFDADGTDLGIYRKMHIPDDPHYYEKFYFTPGDLGFRSFQTKFGKVGVCICWDQWFPEAARLTALTGAQFLFYPTAIGWLHDEKKEYGLQQVNAWETMMRSHAIANGVFVAAPNRIGIEENIEFFTLTYEAPLRVASHREFERISPLRYHDRRADRDTPVSCSACVRVTHGVSSSCAANAARARASTRRNSSSMSG
jgi:N-carbamoylputrescine amidase